MVCAKIIHYHYTDNMFSNLTIAVHGDTFVLKLFLRRSEICRLFKISEVMNVIDCKCIVEYHGIIEGYSKYTFVKTCD